MLLKFTTLDGSYRLINATEIAIIAPIRGPGAKLLLRHTEGEFNVVESPALAAKLIRVGNEPDRYVSRLELSNPSAVALGIRLDYSVYVIFTNDLELLVQC